MATQKLETVDACRLLFAFYMQSNESILKAGTNRGSDMIVYMAYICHVIKHTQCDGEDVYRSIK